MTVAVTGGSGFIGSHVVDALLRRGLDVRLVDRHQSPYHPNGRTSTALVDLRDPVAVREALEGCDAVLHLAAAADVGQVVADPRSSEDVNTRGTLNVLEDERDTGVGRVVYASTSWVYGEQPDGVAD